MSRFALLSYQLVMSALTPLVCAGFVIRSRKQEAYRERLKERLGFTPFMSKQDSIVIHGSSVGEIVALEPFIKQAVATFPDREIIVTSFTPTGSKRVQETLGGKIKHCYLPIDNPLSINLFLTRVNPSAIVLMETEIWPSLIHQASKKGVALLLVNGRLSDRSHRQYRKIKPLITPSLEKIHRILAQSKADAERFISLGSNPDKTKENGNFKYDLAVSTQTHALCEELHQLVESTIPDRIIWVVGSTHTAEESLILDSYALLKQSHPSLLLILVPRHTERFKPLYDICEQSQLHCVRRSKREVPTLETDIWLFDTIGELLAFYSLGDICTVAGSFGDAGGHNPLEPGLFNKAVTVGPNMSNARELTSQLISANAIVQHDNSSSDSIAKGVLELLTHKEKKIALGNRLHQFIEANQGASKKAISTLKHLLRDKSTP